MHSSPDAPRPLPELLAPAGSLDAVRAAVANGADAVYLGASMYNARDEGAQLSLDELRTACAIAHGRGVRVYLTFNVLIKPHELAEALTYLGECIECGIDAAIVQDLGIVRLIRAVYPALEIHGSTQMTVHDASGARVMERIGVERVVLARENTLEDIAAIRAAVPGLGIETFVHGALCISYSGQCFMSGMISDRSANRGSCAQSCRKDYTLNDEIAGNTLDRGYLISAKDLAAHDHLAAIAQLGVGCLKIEGRKKKPEYVATVTRGYRGWLDRIGTGDLAPPPAVQVEPLVQIFSRGNTGGMYGGRVGREYITRAHPDNRGLPIGTVTSVTGDSVVIAADRVIVQGDGLGFEHAESGTTMLSSAGGTVWSAKPLAPIHGTPQYAATLRWSGPARPQPGWRVVRSSDVTLLERASASFRDVRAPDGAKAHLVDVRLFGSSGGPLKSLWSGEGFETTVRSEIPLTAATKRALDYTQLREQLGRLGSTEFTLGSLDSAGLGDGLFMPVSELNRMRQRALEALSEQLEWSRVAHSSALSERIANAIANVPARIDTIPRGERVGGDGDRNATTDFALRAVVYSLDQARDAAANGATEIVFDPFIRHPVPPRSRVLALRDELAARGVSLRLRTPVIVRPADRPRLDKWLALELPLLTGHLGLLAEQASLGRDVIADYAVNAFNQHTASLLFELGAKRITASVELTVGEIAEVVSPWGGQGFDALVYGRTEGMTIEHCVLSAAFDRTPTTCRDLCVQKHPQISVTDPAGYTFAVATDSDCRNRLLHSRPIAGSEFLPALWSNGVRGYDLVFNVPGDDVSSIVSSYRAALDALAAGERAPLGRIKDAVGRTYTRGHFARAV